jgi:cysteine desulfurase
MIPEKTIYLDHAATTAVADEVLAAMWPYFQEDFGNPASAYRSGTLAAQAVNVARDQVASLLNASTDEIFITSGGTESNNWAIKGMIGDGKKRHFIISAIEHHSVLNCIHFIGKLFGFPTTILPVNGYGQVEPETLREAIRDDTALVSIMHANNEIGTVQAIREFADIAHGKGALFHTDAVQGVGRIPVDVEELGVDLLSLSAHKFYGPKGVGVLFIRQGTRIQAFHHGGGQEAGRRAGTLNVPGIVGMGAAAALAQANLKDQMLRERELLERLWHGLSTQIDNVRRNGHRQQCLPNILSISIPGVDGLSLQLGLDLKGIQVSLSSACATGSQETSHVLKAIGIPAELARGSIRLSLGRENTGAEIRRVIEVMPKIVGALCQKETGKRPCS